MTGVKGLGVKFGLIAKGGKLVLESCGSTELVGSRWALGQNPLLFWLKSHEMGWVGLGLEGYLRRKAPLSRAWVELRVTHWRETEVDF